jgi:GTPase
MSIPRVAIVGRPNAGKSSLMNMIAGSKVSIVDPTPGVTRDRVSAIVEIPHPDGLGPIKPVEFVDTGGFGVYVTEGGRFDEIGNDLTKLTDSIEFQIQQAVDHADIVLFAIDAQQGLTHQDREIARLLRQRGLGPKSTRKNAGTKKKDTDTKKSKSAKSAEADSSARDANKPAPQIRIVASKVDGPKWESSVAELSALGFGEPMAVSAKTNYFRREFMDNIYEMLPKPDAKSNQKVMADMAVAIIGKRNAGKSSLVNTLAGEPRVIVSEIPGTTRDAVDVRFEIEGRTIVAIDTAGLRRKRSFQNAIEHFAFDRVQRAIDRSDVVLLLLDANDQISQVDEQLAELAKHSFKPCVVVINKWDMVQGKPGRKGIPVTAEDYEEYLRKELKALPYAPIAFMSGKNGQNVRATIDLAYELKQQAADRVTTGVLNRLIRKIVERQGPTDTKGTQAKVYYVAQTGVEPPTITLVVNYPELFRPNYLKFLINRLREETPFKEVPIRLVVRARRQREEDLPFAEEGGVRVRRGRKGVSERLGSRKTKAGSVPIEARDMEFEALGEKLLSDEHTTVFNNEEFSDEADEYFKD